MIAEFGYELLVHRTNEFPFKIFRAMRKFRLLLPATELKVCHKKSSLHISDDLSLCSRLNYIRLMSIAHVRAILMLEYSYASQTQVVLTQFAQDTCDLGVLFCWLVSELSGVDPSPLLSKSPSLSFWRASGSNIKLGSGCRVYFSSDEVQLRRYSLGVDSKRTPGWNAGVSWMQQWHHLSL